MTERRQRLRQPRAVTHISTRKVAIMTGWKPPVELYSASDKSTFAYESTTKRWPRILTQQIDELNGSFDSPDVSGNPDKLKEAKELINQIANLKYEIMHDRALP